MPTIKLSDTEVLQVIHHINNLDMAKHLAMKLQQAINSGKDKPIIHDHTDGVTRQKIANALGMDWGSPTTTEAILEFIKENCTKDMRLQMAMMTKDNAKAAELLKVMAELLELPENKRYADMPEMLTLALAESGRRSNVIRDQALQIEQDARDNEYLRASLKQIEEALVLPPGYTAAYLVEQVGIRAKAHEKLEKLDAKLTQETNRANEYAADIGNLTSKLERIRNIMNAHPRSSNSEWALIAEVLS